MVMLDRLDKALRSNGKIPGAYCPWRKGALMSFAANSKTTGQPIEPTSRQHHQTGPGRKLPAASLRGISSRYRDDVTELIPIQIAAPEKYGVAASASLDGVKTSLAGLPASTENEFFGACPADRKARQS